MSEALFQEAARDIAEMEAFLATFNFTLDKVPSDGGWTASQCLAHLADAEISLSLRIRMMLTSEDYNFAGWDEDAFAELKKDRDSRTSVAVFNSLRTSNIELLSGLNEQQLVRMGRKANGEPISIIDYFAAMSRHVRNHLEQASKAAQG